MVENWKEKRKIVNKEGREKKRRGVIKKEKKYNGGGGGRNLRKIERREAVKELGEQGRRETVKKGK